LFIFAIVFNHRFQIQIRDIWNIPTTTDFNFIT
jgi:hypothetical protein